jgi:hypothetical protein
MPQEVLHTVLQLPPLPGDPTQLFEFDPKSTVGVEVDAIVEYGCEQAPTVRTPKIRGLNQVGFIFSSEYDIDAGIDDFKRVACKVPNCERAVQFEVTIVFFIYLKLGLGFGLGAGTGTLGFTTRPSVERTTFTTRCICCDQS